MWTFIVRRRSKTPERVFVLPRAVNEQALGVQIVC